jgi:hypothetical protein
MATRLISIALLVACAVGGCQVREQARPSTVHCYRTLALPDCHATPVASWEHRLIGSASAPR